MNKVVYLAGPISHLSYDQATGWREEVRDQLLRSGIKVVSPLRAKVYLRDMKFETIPDNTSDIDEPSIVNMSTPRGIMTRDRFDCMNCGVLFVNLLGAKTVSIGTVMEIAWADAKRTPIVLVIEKSGNVHDHAMVNEATGFRVSTLEHGIEVVKSILGDY